MNGYVSAHVGVNIRNYIMKMVKLMNPTMKDIARMANVSTNTVSRALNDKKEISEETRNRIKEIATELNYTPNSIAASLASQKTNTIGLVTPDIGDPFHALQVRGVEDMAREQGYSVILINTDEDPETEIEAVNTLRSIRVAGMILNSVFPDVQYFERLQKQNIPFVLLNRRLPNVHTDYVVNDNYRGAYEATTHLLKLGHTKIALILGPLRITSVRDRYEGFARAMNEAGVAIDKNLIAHSEFSKPEAGEVLATQLINTEPRPTAILAYCDTLAIGAYAAVFKLGLSIPNDIALIGYDDILFASYLEVPLTTVAQPAYEMGQVACGIILERIKLRGEGVDLRGLPKKQTVFEPHLVVRKSCGAYLRNFKPIPDSGNGC